MRRTPAFAWWHADFINCPCGSDCRGGTTPHDTNSISSVRRHLSISPGVLASTVKMQTPIRPAGMLRAMWRFAKITSQHCREGRDNAISVSYHLSPGFFQYQDGYWLRRTVRIPGFWNVLHGVERSRHPVNSMVGSCHREVNKIAAFHEEMYLSPAGVAQ